MARKNMDINWLMGYIEAKGNFSISNQRIKVKKSKFTPEYIFKLTKPELIQFIIQFSDKGTIFYKLKEKFPRSPLRLLWDQIMIFQFTDEFLSVMSIDNLRKLLAYVYSIIPPIGYEYQNFPRPAFSLTFHKKDNIIADKIKKYFEKQGIKIYGPYITNQGLNLRLEIKGYTNCMLLYDFLMKQKWFTSKKEKFEEWGNKILGKSKT